MFQKTLFLSKTEKVWKTNKLRLSLESENWDLGIYALKEKHKSPLALPGKISKLSGSTFNCNLAKPYLTYITKIIIISYPNPSLPFGSTVCIRDLGKLNLIR